MPNSSRHSKTASGSGAGSDQSDSGSDAGSADSSASGLLGGSPAAEYSSLIPQALTDSIMSGGGLGIAKQIAASIDPAINDTRSTKA